MQSCVLKTGMILCLAAALTSCSGYNSGAAGNAVAQVTLTPASVSVIAGEVSQLSFNATTVSGGTPSPAPTFTFNSSNTQVATVSPSGLVCGGVWDSLFIVCNGNNSMGNPVQGTATITATAGGVSSSPVQATVHPVVTSVVVNPIAGCTSIKGTQQFTGHACSSKVTPPDTTGPCAPNAKEITNLVGPISWISTTTGVASIDANGVATATVPGFTDIVATVGTISSAPVGFRTCMPIEIRLHLNGDPPGQPSGSAGLAVAGTATLQADMVDENGVTTASAPVQIVSANTEVASISGVTLTGVSPGGAALLGVCSPPACGAGFTAPIPFYSNVFTVSVSGGSPATFVYATSTFTPPSGTSPTMIPIDTSKSPPTAGTALTLPGTPNSLIFTVDGSAGYMGTNAGTALFQPGTGVVSLVSPFVGKVLAVSPDGSVAIFSNAASVPDPVTGVVGPIEPDGPSQRVLVLTASNNSAASFVLPGAIAAAFTGDSSKAFIATNTGNVYVFSPTTSQQTISIGSVSTDVTTVAAGPYAYFANPGNGLEVVATCNNVQQPIANNPPTNSTTLQMLGSIGNTNKIVAVDSTGVDIVSVFLNSILSTNPPLPFVYSPANCAPPVSYSNQFVDFGLGAFTAHQLIVPSDGTTGLAGSHIVVLPAGINKVLVAVPGQPGGTIPLAGAATEALSGGMTLDGNTLWVGVGGSNSVDEIVLTNSADTVQIPMSFKKSDGSAAPPNLVVVQPK